MQNHAFQTRQELARDIASCRPILLKRARSLVGSVDAEDLVQSTIERALTHLDDFEPESNMVGWLRRIMFSRTVDEWRRHKSRVTSLEDPDELPCPPADTPPIWNTLTAEDVRAAVRTLPPRFRTVFELHHDWGVSYQAIARQLGMRLGTVGTRLRRARLHLRRVLTATLDAQAARGVTPPVAHAAGSPAIATLSAHRKRQAPRPADSSVRLSAVA